MRRFPQGPLVGAVLAAALAAVLTAPLAGPASADPAPTPVPGTPGFSVGDLGTDAATRAPTLPEARAEAARLRTETDALVRRASLAADRAERAEVAFHAAVTRAGLAEQRLAELQRAAVATDEESAERVRDIYMAGGRAGMLNSLMSAGSVSDLETRGQMITGVVLDGRERAREAKAQAEAAARVREELRRIAQEQTTAAKAASDEVTEAVRLLGQRRQMLRDADAMVTALLAEQRRAALEARARQRAAQHASARQVPSAAAPGTAPSARRLGGRRTQPAVDGSRWVRPAVGPLTSRYGPRWGRMHRGMDIGARNGSVIRAAGDGTVTLARFWGGYGNAVVVDHGGGLTTRYGHSQQLLVAPGDDVVAGQPIALVGSTGNSTGPHLHFEVRLAGLDVDPQPFLRARGVQVG